MAYKKKQEGLGFIYYIYGPSHLDKEKWDIRYVGQTLSPEERYSWTQYKNNYEIMATDRLIDCWLKSIISRDIIPELKVVETVDISQCLSRDEIKLTMDKAEKRHVKLQRDLGKHLLNGDEGGWGNTAPTPETKMKMSDAQKRRTLENNRKPSPKRTKLMIEKALNSKRVSDEIKFCRQNRPVIQCDQEDNEICEWESAHLAAKELGLAYTNIRRSCEASKLNKKPSYCGGCRWKWKNPDGEEPIILIVLQLDENKNLIREWESAEHVEKELNIKSGLITRYCRTNLKKSYKSGEFYWKYKNPEIIPKRVTGKPSDKKIAQIDKITLEIIKIWDYITQIQKELGVSKGTVANCCNGNEKRPHKNYTHHGFIWRWAQQNENNELNNSN